VIARPAPPAVGRALLVVAAVLLALLAIFLVVVSFASYATVKRQLDQYASDGDAELSPDRFATIVWQLRGLAVAMATISVAAFVRRRRLAHLGETFLRSAAADTRAAAAALGRTVALEPRLHLAAFGGILVAAVLVRVEFLFQPMRYDEAGTYVHYASQPLYIGLTAYTAPNNHLLHTFLVHVSTAIFGDQPWAIRLPALVAGILLVPATYLAGRLLYGRSAALVAAALVATSSVLVEYSTNARGYTLVALAFMLLLALGAHLPRTASPAAWTAFAILGALGLFTVPTFLYALGAAVAWLGVETGLERRELLRSRLLPALVGCTALTAGLYAPVIAVSGLDSLVGNRFVESRTWSYFAEHLPSSLADVFRAWHRDQPVLLWIALAAAFALGFLLHRRVGRTSVSPWLGLIAFVPPSLAAQRVVPFERTWLFALPLYLLTASAGLVLLGRRFKSSRWHSIAVPVAAMALSALLTGKAVASQAVYHSEDTSTFRDAPEVAAFLAGELRPGDRVLVVPPADLILEYYLNMLRFDAGGLLYSDFSARRYLVVVKPPPDGYPLPTVISWRLSPETASNLQPVLMRMFSRSQVYELVPEAG
jgi:hypothetical protein